MNIDCEIINAHKQCYKYSCIPSSVEMILKLLKRIEPNDYHLQEHWDNRTNGSFADFDNKIIKGVTFYQRSNPDAKKLFEIIDKELNEGRFVSISLKIPPNEDHHMYIIYDYDKDGIDYKAFTKQYQETSKIIIDNVKDKVKSMKDHTTDILIYSSG